MNRRSCTVCNAWSNISDLSQYDVCKTCTAMEEKLSPEVYDWLMRLIEAKIERTIDKHESRYQHEGSGYY